MKLEQIILKEIIKNEEYSRKVLPYLKREYFSDPKEKLIFDEINNFITKYNVLPKFSSISIEIDNSNSLNDSQIKEAKEYIENLANDNEENKSNFDWLINSTEKFCQEKAIYNAMMESLEIMKDPKESKGKIPELLSNALSISFDPYIGHNFLEDYEERYEFYHKKENKIPFDIDILNQVTNGGLPEKTLSVIVGGVNVGKTLFLCHLAAADLAAGYDVLYITLEMAEEEISKRIDANLLNIDIDILLQIPKDDYVKRIEKFKSKTNGTLIIKEYPTSSASSLTFKGLLNELWLKKKFRPKKLYIDYINICASSRIRMGNSINTYTYVKSIAEELRGLAVEFKLPIITATQLTRQGFSNSDPDMTDVAESFGLPAVADWMIAIVTTPELEKLNQLSVSQIKSRLGDKSKNRKFVLGIEKSKFRLYDVEQNAQEELVIKPIEQPKEKFFKEKMKDFKW